MGCKNFLAELERPNIRLSDATVTCT